MKHFPKKKAPRKTVLAQLVVIGASCTTNGFFLFLFLFFNDVKQSHIITQLINSFYRYILTVLLSECTPRTQLSNSFAHIFYFCILFYLFFSETNATPVLLWYNLAWHIIQVLISLLRLTPVAFLFLFFSLHHHICKCKSAQHHIPSQWLQWQFCLMWHQGVK